jgi:hypothetical protein
MIRNLLFSHCKAGISWKNADYVESTVVNCNNCHKSFQHINCINCKKPNFWKNANYEQSKVYDCSHCHKKFQQIICPNCRKSNYWKNADCDFDKACICDHCHQYFQRLICLNCNNIIILKNYLQGVTYECSNCQEKCVHINCPHCDLGFFKLFFILYD